MSVEIIKKEIARFLNSETPEVMAIKGKWGTGKTYTWNEFLKESEQNKNIKLKTYSYVSLFGINSLDEFKYTIFKNSVDKELIDKGVGVDSFINNIDSLLKHFGKKSLFPIEIFSRILTRINLVPVLESIAFSSVDKKIICIDDLERKGKNLDIKDILGLVSVLKEQKNCKVVLLLNDGEEGLDDYIKYREKVIDIELEFAPTVDENVEIAFKGQNSYTIQILKESAIKLNIKNIRILKQIERLVNIVMDCLGTDYEPEITQQVVSSLTLFAWCYYCHESDGAPPLDYITKQGIYIRPPIDWNKLEAPNNSNLNKKEDNKEEKEKHKKWDTVINSYGYKDTDDFDLILFNVVKTGYCIDAEMKTQADNINNEVKSYKSNKLYQEAWSFFYSSFNDNVDAVVELFYKTLQSNIEIFTLNHLYVYANLFRELGENEKANEMIDFYFKARKDYISSFSLSSYEGQNIKDEYIISKINEVNKQIPAIEETATQVLERISGKNGYSPSPDDKNILSETTVEQYIELFKSINDEKQLNSFVYTCLRFGQIINADDEDKEINNRTMEALKRIAKESKINKLRIKSLLNIEIE